VLSFSLLLIGVPLLIAFLPGSLAHRSGTHLNIPNRTYWLAPERRDTTLPSSAATANGSRQS
jgi:hypothetical protein